MAVRCSGCNKFCSVQVADVDDHSVELADGKISGEVTFTLESECCSESVGTARLSLTDEPADVEYES